ncbi:MAG: hypothetical protein QOK19_2391 [Solirubrobacteraceae bacterium]|nr:hypothetical protein [Solirubrobacteraceae bacterium]
MRECSDGIATASLDMNLHTVERPEAGGVTDSMLLDAFMPEFDATRIEHRVIDARPARVYEVAIRTDLAEVLLRSHVVSALFGVRAAGERLLAMARGPRPEGQLGIGSMRLAELPDHGAWIRLGEDSPSEFVFGVVGRFWAGQTSWADVASRDFVAFREPGYARIAANLSVRSYGDRRALLSYEARTQATDDAARRAFLRYWNLASPGAGVVMRSALALIADETRRSGSGA